MMKKTALAGALGAILLFAGANEAGALDLAGTLVRADRGEPAAMLAVGKHYLANRKPSEGLLYLERAASTNAPQAAFANTALGKHYESLEGQYARELAVVHYQKGAIAGDVEAQVRLGKIFLGRAEQATGQERTQYQVKAQMLLEHAADLGNSSEAAFALGRAFHEAKAMEANRVEAERWLSRAARADHPEAAFMLGEHHLAQGNAKSAERFLTAAAKAGNGQAMLRLANEYKEGGKLTASLDEAKRWAQSARDAGVSGAAALLSEVTSMESRIAGMVANQVQGPAVATKAVAAATKQVTQPSSGNPLVDQLRRENEELRRQVAEIMKMLGKDGAPEVPAAQIQQVAAPTPELADHDEDLNGRGLDAHSRGEFKEAYRLFSRAVKRGDVDAMNNLGMLLLQGQGVSADPVKALEMFRAAAEKGHATAAHNIGYIYENGIGVRPDLARSRVWYRHAGVLNQRLQRMSTMAGI